MVAALGRCVLIWNQAWWYFPDRPRYTMVPVMATTGINYQYRAATHSGAHSYLYPAVSKLLKDIPTGSTVVDMGCGNGSFLSQFQDRGWKLYGYDFSPSGIEIARKSFPGIEFFLADAEASLDSFTAGKVDAVLSTEVIEHLYSPRKFLRNIHDLLKPGGTVVLTTPYHGYLKNLALAVAGRMDFHYTALMDYGHIKFWSKKSLTTILIETGFREIEFVGSGRAPWLWKSIAVKARAGAIATADSPH